VLAPATLAALPSTRAIPDRDVFYVADPVSSIRGSAVPARARVANRWAFSCLPSRADATWTIRMPSASARDTGAELPLFSLHRSQQLLQDVLQR